MSAQRHCVCFRCIDDDHPNGKLISAKQYNRHRLQDAYMAVPLSKARQASPTDADYDHADYEDESPDSPGPTSPLPRSSPEPRSSSPYDEVSSQLGLDVEMDDLTDNLGRLNTGPKFDYMLQQRNLGAGAVWDVPDDEDGEPEQAMPGEDDDDEPIDREWDLAEDGFDWGLYERAGKDGRLTADDILDSLLVSEVANQDDALTEEDIAIARSTNKTLYIPCDRLTHPTAEEPLTYDPRNLPLRTHEEFYAQAKEVSDARTAIAADELARKYGIKGLPILYHVKSLRFPHSFPFDFMHLIWENLIPNLILLWTNEFKGLDHGMRDYTIDKAIWEAVGKQTAEAGDTIPGAFGARGPKHAEQGRRVQRPAYYDHFVLLVQILTKCLQFDITRQELDWLRVKIPLWVEKYEEIYYQYDPRRLSTCTLTIHALLHIPDSIEMAGPQWCYWAYPMERFCGRLQPGIRNRRFPYPSLDRHVLETARITQIGMLYNISHELSMKHSRAGGPERVGDVKDILRPSFCTEWSKIRRVDSEAGDTMVGVQLAVVGDAQSGGLARRDFCAGMLFVHRIRLQILSATQYEMYTDRNERRRTVDVELQGEQFYGRLQHIYRINLNNAEPITTEPKSKKVKPITIPRWYSMIIVEVESCILTDVDKRLDLPFYKAMGRPHMTDATSLACVVGRVPDGQGGWGIVDRSGNLARAMYIDDL
ncbi:hypothetical protein MKEN_01266800 [Mycena kentingensis (nom. inval.)]|nr:hypothetical protein MKEN_01266800 [Mycena kentingensis (nom. inval.)]